MKRVNRDGIEPDVILDVIVVNDGGPVLDQGLLINLLPGVIVMEQANTGPAGSRYAGILAASQLHLVFIDDD